MTQAAEVAPSYGLLTSLEEFGAVIRKLAADRLPVGFDIETGYEGESREEAQLHPEENLVAGFSLTNDLSWARYVALNHELGNVNLDCGRVAELLWALFHVRDAEGLPLAVSHGAIFEKRCMARFFMKYLGHHAVYGPQVLASGGYFPVRSCTMLESYVEARHVVHGLKPITLADAGHKMTEIMDLFPEGLTQREKNSIRFHVLDPTDPKVFSYACEDSVWCLWHHILRWHRVRSHPIYKLEMALLEEVIPGMSDWGVYYDWNLVRDAARKAHEFLPLYELDVREAFAEVTGKPCDINFASPLQVQKLLYEDMGLPVIKKTKKGKPSTNAKEVLVNYVKDHPAVAKLVAWKELQTLCSNYLDIFERKYSYANDGMTHPNFIQHGTISGRGAHASPNYAQSSKKKYHLVTKSGAEFKFQWRRVIGAPPGWYMLGFDYSMVELRVVAGEAQEESLLEAFRNGVDVHRQTASLMLSIPVEQVGKEERQTGKTCNFSLGYGQSAQALAERLGVSLEHAEELYGIYHASYPRLNKKRNQVIRQAQQDGFVITKFGRRVPLPDIHSPERWKRSEAERTAGNVFVQGPGSGDYPKMAMVRAVRALKLHGLDDRVKLVMNIHDALEFYVRKDVPPAQVVKVLAPAVVFPVPGWPPIVADWHMGMNWAGLYDLEVLPGGEVRVKKEDSKPALKEDIPVDAEDAEPDVVDYPEGTAGTAGGSENGSSMPGLHSGEPGAVASAVQPRRLVIGCEPGLAVRDMEKLLKFLRTLPGPHTVVVRTSAGAIELPGTFGLQPGHEPEVSIIIGGARVYYDESSVDMAQLGDGLEL